MIYRRRTGRSSCGQCSPSPAATSTSHGRRACGPRRSGPRYLDAHGRHISSPGRPTTASRPSYDDLTTRGRIDIARKIETARELGDLSENGDYHAAKEEQGKMEGRIRHLAGLLENAEIVEADGGRARVAAGVGRRRSATRATTTRALPHRLHRGAPRRPRRHLPRLAARRGPDRLGAGRHRDLRGPHRRRAQGRGRRGRLNISRLGPDGVAEHEEREAEHPERVLGPELAVDHVHVELLGEPGDGERCQLGGVRVDVGEVVARVGERAAGGEDEPPVLAGSGARAWR